VKRLAIAIILGLGVAVAVVAAFIMADWTNPFGTPYRAEGGPVPIGGPFTLVGEGGRAVSSEQFRGKWRLIYFGYTHCPDACPTALNDIGVALDMLKGRADTVAPIFISVDPDRDTPAVVTAYARQFSPRIMGLTGTDAQIGAAEKEFHVYAARHPSPGGGYTMDHSNIIYVMDPKGHFAGIIDGSANPEDIAAQVGKFEA
jgi:protein SCO1/2